MNKQDYNCTFTVSATPGQVFDSICRVSSWWTENTEGNTNKAGDIFTVRFGKTYSTFCIMEMIPNGKIVWLVTDSHLEFLNDKEEWNNTSLDFEITASAEGTTMSMTHLGLVPGIECFDDCKIEAT